MNCILKNTDEYCSFFFILIYFNPKEFFTSGDPKSQKQFLKDNHISYIYLAKDEIKKPLNLVDLGLQKAFENEDVLVLKVL